jgi:pimeloyl-ACP methyl ester carboxylesterase
VLLHLRDQGSGDPIVLIHGAGTSGAIWGRVIAGLAESRRVVAPDLPGYGSSPPIGHGFEFADVADRVAVGLRKAGVKPPYDLVGHSLGGALALTLAARHPDRIRRLVLVAPAGLAPVPEPIAALLGLAAEPFAWIRRSLALPFAASPLARRIALAGVARDGARVPAADARAVLASSEGASRIGAGLAAAASADLTETLAELPLPVGFIWGELDPVIPARRIELVKRLRPGAPIEVVDGTAHAPMLERPAEFAYALQSVLGQLGGVRCEAA